MSNLQPTITPLPASLASLRLNLEAQIESLNAALRHWQRWEAEYEGFAEDIRRLEEQDDRDEQRTRADMLRIGVDLGSDLLTEKEILELVGPEGSASSKSVNAVCERIARRVEYVQQNIKTLQKQLDATEMKLEKLLVVAAPEATDEQGLPLMEIHEELDDVENVISGTVTQAQNGAPMVVQALKKAGIVEGDLADTTTASQPDEKSISPTVDKPDTKSPSPSEFNVAPATTTQPKPPTKKSVSFAADTKDSIEAATTTNTVQHTTSKLSLEEVAKASFNKGDRVLELDDYDRVINTTAVIPTEESPEDAALRREMLEYHMNEVGSIVAQLDLDERGSTNSDVGEDFDDDEDYDEDMASASSIEEEDEHGMNRGTRLHDSYRAEMLALERKLNASMLQNVGPRPDLSDSMDIDDSNTSASTALLTAPSSTSPAPLKDITEKPPSTTISPPTNPERKPSRFKQERTPKPPNTPAPAFPTPSESHSSQLPKVLGDVVERSPSSAHTTSAQPKAPLQPDDFDPALHHQEITNEYYAQRNRLIQKQGGFLQNARHADEDDAEVPVDELYEYDENGRAKKVSLFKAARVRRTQ